MRSSQNTRAAIALACCLAAPLPAQAFSWREGWNAALDLGVQAMEMVTAPVTAAASWTMRRIHAAEHAAAEALHGFVATLRDDLQRFETLAERAGFRLTAVTIKPGIIPEIELIFEPGEEISAEGEAALRVELAALHGTLGMVERRVLLLLLDIDQTLEQVRPAGFRVGEVEVALVTIFPELTVNFVRGNHRLR